MKNFIEELLKVNDKFEENTKKGMSDINIFEALGVEYKENYHSKFIAYLIDPHGDHYVGGKIKSPYGKIKSP